MRLLNNEQTMNNKEFISALARRTKRKNADTEAMLTTVINAMGERFQEGDSVQLPNFGMFEVKKKLERIMVNPSTGQRMLIPPKLVLAFKPNPAWRNQIKNDNNENNDNNA